MPKSLRGSAPTTVEWPACLAAELAALVLAVTCAMVMEAVIARHPQGIPGPGLCIGGLLLAWQVVQLLGRNRPMSADLGRDGRWRVRFRDGRMSDARLDGRTRILGSSLVLRWRSSGRPASVWLTVLDVPVGDLRGLSVRLKGADLRVGS